MSGEAQGVRSLTSQEFSLTAAVGGWRGLVESVAPGFVFVVAYVITSELKPSLIAAITVTALAVLARLARRSPLTYALGGVLGVVIGAIAAVRTGEAGAYFVWGLITNAVFLVGVLISLAVRWPLVGLVVSSLGLDRSKVATAQVQDASPLNEPTSAAALFDTSWRRDPAALRRYTLATWLWFGAFALRLAVQVPLYLAESVTWLGVARLTMGLPLWSLVLWLTWILVRSPKVAEAAQQESPLQR